MVLTGAEIIANVLIEQGVDTVFGYPGGAVLNIYDALYTYKDKITHYMTAHEQGASHAADGYARASGKTGVCLSTSGPGATNLVTGIATAYMDSIPMVAITGNVSTDLLGKDSFQEVYIAGITQPITKHSFIVYDVKDLAPTLRLAFRLAQSGRKGPVLVDVPKDVTAAKAEYKPVPPKKDEAKALPEVSLEKAAKLINSAKKPLVYFGGGVTSCDGGEELLALLQKADIPATHTIMAAGAIDCDESHNLGLIGMHGKFSSNMAVDNCDLLLAIGTRFSDRVALNTKKFAKKAKIVHIDIDESEINKNVAAYLSVIGDIKVLLKALVDKVEPATHPEWMAQVKKYKEMDFVPVDDDSVLTPHQVLQTISKMSGEDSIYVTDVGQHQMWAAQYLAHKRPRSFLTSGGLGTMGYGYGAAIGAQVYAKDRHVIHITGDGSFHMNLNEACTAVTYELPVITVIFNNSALGMVRQWQTVFYNKRYSSSEPDRKTDYVTLAKGFGAVGYSCKNLAEFKQAFGEALKSKGPVWIECKIDREERVLPMIPPGKSVEDTIKE